MLITEEHLQRIFNEIEEYTIKNCDSSHDYEVTMSTAWIMRTKLLNVLRADSEEILELWKIISKDFMEILKKENGNLLNFKYSCGHTLRPDVIFSIIKSIGIHNEWKSDPNNLCVECWTKKK